MKRAHKSNPEIAIGYLRASTDDQRLGPEAQRAAIEAWAASAGVTVAAFFTDQGVSGAAEIADRPGLLAALAALRANGAGCFVVAKRDRIARDAMVAGMIDRAVAAAGARTVAADGAGNGEGASDLFMRSILDAAAAYERALIRSRTSAALKAKRARGERAGEVPFGFHLAADGARLETDAAEQAIIATVRSLRDAGVSLRAVVADLAAAGHIGRTGKPLGLTQVARIASVAA